MTLADLKPFAPEVLDRMASRAKLQFYEGPVRSGKTLASILALMWYISETDVSVGMISGNTVGSVIRNVIKTPMGILDLFPCVKLVSRKGSDMLEVRKGDKTVTIYIFGASDAASDSSLRGLSIDFWYADEITKHHLNFISEALSRSSASDHPYMVWTANPDNPRNRIYTEYTDRYLAMTPEEDKAFGGYHEFHFRLEDNPIMTAEKIAALKMLYTGYEYDRKILGIRCIAEGLIYPKMSDAHFRDIAPGDVDVRYCAIDFGTDHATVMLFGGMFRGNKKDWRIVREFCDERSDKTTYDYYVCFLNECKALGIDPQKVIIAIDPAARVLALEFRSHGLNTVKAKNDVLDGINYTRNALYNGIVSFGPARDFPRLRSESGTYSWDPKASQRGEDRPIKEHDDAMDAWRYFAYTFVRPIAGG